MPEFLHRYTAPLHDAPFTHITAFLLLHELTAIIPLFGLAGVFHYSQWLPPFVDNWEWVEQGAKRFGHYFRRKGWLDEEAEDAVATNGAKSSNKSEGGTRVVIEYANSSQYSGVWLVAFTDNLHRFATAYAITKVLLPLRLLLSVWGTPWFARFFISPCMALMNRVPGSKIQVSSMKSRVTLTREPKSKVGDTGSKNLSKSR